MERGATDKAADMFRKCVEINPQHEPSRVNLNVLSTNTEDSQMMQLYKDAMDALREGAYSAGNSTCTAHDWHRQYFIFANEFLPRNGGGAIIPDPMNFVSSQPSPSCTEFCLVIPIIHPHCTISPCFRRSWVNLQLFR